ncbi:protein of unknown function (plasmid) [Paraburkholderia kururiensis]
MTNAAPAGVPLAPRGSQAFTVCSAGQAPARSWGAPRAADLPRRGPSLQLRSAPAVAPLR